MTPTQIHKGHAIFQTIEPEKFRAIFPALREAEVQGRRFCAVPHTLENARLLRNLGIAAPSPIRFEYRWPIMPGRTPGWWQIDTAEFLTLNPRAFVLSGMRTRKTLSTLWAADYLMRKKIIKRSLVVAPLSTLERVWGDHLFMNFHHRSFAVLHGTAEKRRRLLDQKHDFYIINHDGLEIIRPELEKRDDINLIIIDEVAVFRNSRTARWKTMKKLVTAERFCWGLTGTPTPNDHSDAFGICKLIKSENYNGSFTRFKNDVLMQVGPFRWVPRRGAEQIVARVLSPSIRFTREVVTDLQPQIIERQAELSPQQKHHINELIKQATTEIGGSTVTAVNAAVLISKLVQASLGAIYSGDGTIARLDFGPRMSVIREVIEENLPGKVIVFAPFTSAIDALASELKKKWTVAVVDGRTSTGKRNEVFRDFQEKKDPHLLVAHPGTMAHGLELSAADLILWAAPCNSNETYQQACCRIDGGGQKNKIDICHVFATSTERKIYDTLKSKGKLQDLALDLIKGKK